MSLPNDIYDPEDVGVGNSPLLTAMNPNLSPSPSPEPLIPLPPVSPESSPDPASGVRKKKVSHQKYRPSPGDAVLVSFMANGKHTDVAQEAALKPLESEEVCEEVGRGGIDIDMMEKMDKVAEIEIEGIEGLMEEKEQEKKNDTMDLATLAAGAVGILREKERASRSPPPKMEKLKDELPQVEHMEDVKASIPSSTSKVLYVDVSVSLSQNMVKHEIIASPTEALPPMRQQSPKSAQSNGSSHIKLPSISESIGDITRLPQPQAQDGSPFIQSPPGMQPPRFPLPSNGHGSPPKSPNDTFRRELPSPASSSWFNHRRPSQVDNPQVSSPIEYSGGSSTETPSTDASGATPAIDRMSIDGITNPQIGGYQCTYSGCNALPFQTQYLLNSHANVHSSNRPHYCSVKGCQRAEGGKGFKRKNEMIRHGLVHDSPGYVCPFCPDREHKYPRPDNLQRHVRVHHMDKDKDDRSLRDVLSQRPEGPSRGRRRRGGTA